MSRRVVSCRVAGSRTVGMVHEDLQTPDAELLGVETSSRSEDFRVINNAPRGAGVVHE
jgi:tryptophan synthase beta subunit